MTEHNSMTASPTSPVYVDLSAVTTFALPLYSAGRLIILSTSELTSRITLLRRKSWSLEVSKIEAPLPGLRCG